MCAWVIPGQPIEVDVEGRQIKIKALTWGEKQQLAEAVDSLADKKGIQRFNEMVDTIAKHVVSISDTDDPVALLQVQPFKMLRKVLDAILLSGSLSDGEVKNFQPSSDGSQQEEPPTATTVTNIGSASDEGKQ